MPKEISHVSPFDKTLSEIYAGGIFPGSHLADSIYEDASHLLRTPEFLQMIKRPSGSVLFENKIKEYTSTLEDKEVVYSVAYRSRGRLKRALGETVLGNEVYLLINHDALQPAAIIVPPEAGDISFPSAAVIVGSEVNNPDHLPRIAEIITGIHVSRPKRY